MPVFEYKCNKCGYVTEVLVKSAGKADILCEKCASSDMKKLLSGFAVGKSQKPAQGCQGCPSGGTCPHSGR